MVAGADDPPFRHQKRRIIDDRGRDRFGQLRADVDLAVDADQKRAFHVGEPAPDLRQGNERLADGVKVAGIRPARRHAGQKPLQVVDSAQIFAQLHADGRVGQQFRHGLLPQFDHFFARQRIGDPVGEHARPHRRDGAVQRGQQRPLPFPVAQGAGNFEAPAARFVDLERFARPVCAERLDVLEGSFLRLFQVVEHHSRGPDRLFVLRHERVETETVEVQNAEVLAEFLLRENQPRGPFGAARDHHFGRQPVRQRLVLADEALGRHDPGELVQKPCLREAGGVKTAGRKVDPRDPDRRVVHHGSGEVVALAGVQQKFLGQRPGRHDARHFAFHDPLGQLRVLHLVADRDAVAAGDHFPDVRLKLVVRKPRHRHRVLPLFAAGERQIQHPRAEPGVVMKQLVEVAHPEKQNRVRAGLLRFEVLLHHRGRFDRRVVVRFRHGKMKRL